MGYRIGKRPGTFPCAVTVKRQELLQSALEFISLRELSLRLNVPTSVIEDWLSGQVPMPDRALFVLSAILTQRLSARSKSR